MDNLKQPPNSLEAEQAVIGAVLLQPACWDEVSFLTADDFYLLRHRNIWRILQSGESSRDPVSVLMAMDDAESRIYVGDLARNTPSAANAKVYAQIVRDRHMLRRLMSECLQIISSIDNDSRPADVIAGAAKRIESITDYAITGPGLRHIMEVSADWYERMDQRNKTHAVAGLNTGFHALDRRWGGMRGGQVIVIAGRPKTGKTTLALNIAEHVAQTAPVAVFQMEMSEGEMADRIIASSGKIELSEIRGGYLSGESLQCALEAFGRLKGTSLYLDATPRQTIDYIRAQSKKFVKERGKGLIMIDYLGLIRTDAKSRTKNDEIAELSRDIKLLAKEADCPVILLCQMNRAVEREKRKPQLSDLRDSGAIEQDADIICFTHKDDVEQTYSEIVTRAMRSGEPGTDYLTCRFNLGRFESAPEGWFPEVKKSNKKKDDWGDA